MCWYVPGTKLHTIDGRALQCLVVDTLTHMMYGSTTPQLGVISVFAVTTKAVYRFVCAGNFPMCTVAQMISAGELSLSTIFPAREAGVEFVQ